MKTLNGFRAVLILLSWASVTASLKIIEGPQSVTNASVGGTVDFKCIAEGAASPPIWDINGEDYRVTELPLNHEYHYSEGYLEITPVTLSMNNSIYYCYYKPYVDGDFIKIESEHATLLISPSARTASLSPSSINTSITLLIPPRHVTANTAAFMIIIFILLLFVLACVLILVMLCCIYYRKGLKKNSY